MTRVRAAPLGAAIAATCALLAAASSVTPTRTASRTATASGTVTPTASWRSGGVISAVAGSYVAATALAFDAAENLLVDDGNGNRIYLVDLVTGARTTFAGTGSPGFSGDGGPASSAMLYYPYGMARDLAGNVLIADAGNGRIRRVDAATRIITTIAGDGVAGYSGDGGPAASARFHGPHGLAVSPATGDLIIADHYNHRVRKVAASTGFVSLVAGNGAWGYSGDNGAATSAQLASPVDIAVNTNDDVFIADRDNHCIRRVASATGVITTIVGTGVFGFAVDGSAATSSRLNWPHGMVFTSQGDLIFAEHGNHRVRMVASGTGIITTIAGNGATGIAGLGGAAINATLNHPLDVALDNAGNVFATENTGPTRVLKITTAIQPSPSTSASPSATPYCHPALFRGLPRTDLVGSLVGTALAPGEAALVASEVACRQACCDAPVCDGYTFAADLAMISAVAPCYLHVNVTQLIPSNGYASGMRESVL